MDVSDFVDFTVFLPHPTQLKLRNHKLQTKTTTTVHHFYSGGLRAPTFGLFLSSFPPSFAFDQLRGNSRVRNDFPLNILIEDVWKKKKNGVNLIFLQKN